MLQALGSRWKGLGSELAFPTVEISKTGNLGLTCRIWFAHFHEVNSVIVSFSPSPSKRILVFFIILIWSGELLLLPSWYSLLAASEERRLLGHPPALELFCFSGTPLMLSNCSLLYSFRYSNTTPVLSLMWSYLVFEDNESGIEVVLCSPFKTIEGQRSQARTGGQRGQEKQRGEGELNSSNFSCWVFLCVMTVRGSWG